MCKTYQIHEVGQYGVIYCLTSPSGKKYIGQSWCVANRWRKYKKLYTPKTQNKLFSAMKKYGPEKFTYEIIDLCENQTEMDRKENFYIMDVYDSMNTGYNCTEGGQASGKKFSKQTITKMSNAKKGKCYGDNNNFYGKHHSQENKLLFSLNNKIRNDKYGNNFKGKCHSDAAKEKIRKSKLGKKLPQHVRDMLKSYTRIGKENYFSKKYIAISPNGIEYVVHGELKKFAKSNNLSMFPIKQYMDKGKIPPPKNEKHNRMTIYRKNSTGWEFKHL